MISALPELVDAQEMSDGANENKHYQQITLPIDRGSDTPSNYDNSAVTKINLDHYDALVEEREIVITNAPADGDPLYGGESSATIKTGDATAGKSTGHSRAEAAITLPEKINFSVKTQNNNLTIKENIGFAGSLYGGQSSIELITGVTTGNDVISSGEYGFSIKDGSINIYGEMEAASLGNQVTLASNASGVDSVIGGEAILTGKSGDARTGNVSSQPTKDVSRLVNRASAFTNIDSNNLILEASQNHITVATDANRLIGGRALAQFNSGDAKSGYIKVDTEDDIAAENYTFANSYVVTKDLTLKADKNWVEAQGNSSEIYGGSAELSLIAGDAIAGGVSYQNGTKIYADVDANAITRATGSSMTANQNSLFLLGNADKAVGGSAAISLVSGDAIAGNISSNSTIYDKNPEYHDPADPEQKLPHKKAFAYSEVYADSMNVQANGNQVEVGVKGAVTNLIGGEISLTLEAGNAKSGAVIHAKDDKQSEYKIDAGANISLENTVLKANNNNVRLLGSLNSGGNIYGGDIHYTITPGKAYYQNGEEISERNSVMMDGTQAYARNNLIELGEFTKVDNGGQLYGGHLTYNGDYRPAQYDLFTGNRLHTSSRSPLHFKEVANFEYYQFTLTPQLANENIAIINADKIIFGSNEQNQNLSSNGSTPSTPSKINVVGIHSGDRILGVGDQFILMQAKPGELRGDATAGIDEVTQIQQGISLLYSVETEVEYENDRVITVIKKGTNKPTDPEKPDPPYVWTNPELKVVGDGRLAMEELLLRGADNLLGIIRKNQIEGYVPFADFYAGHSKYANGSVIRANEYIITMGMTYKKENWVIAPIVEYGWSDYKNHTQYVGQNGNRFTSRGSGDNYYYGLGLLSRYSFDNGLYLDGGVRYGKSRSKFNSQDLAHAATGELAHYKISSPYWGAHFSVGYEMPIAENQHFDLSSTFLWTRLNRKNSRVVGDEIHFGAINSKRLNVGAEWHYDYRPDMSFRAGIAYEYEFDTQFNLHAYRMKVDTTSLKGSTGIVKVGTSLKPSESSRFSYDADLSGYFGKRKGGEISVRVNYEL
ncbi:hypothetical protein GCM10007161_02390 [Ignatzschineria indica]|uniref:Autotransporter domain-containing protein n=2 Tax=Ignatzschineria indica TaxID=472583 RepID=A0A2U2AM17_9GAMM|nr:hypothetical protein DC082_01520 [Ignatzschineria indica]GGZ75051.1 hypothetical protein GCM10007161_02390 [Ignatzschineria indica]